MSADERDARANIGTPGITFGQFLIPASRQPLDKGNWTLATDVRQGFDLWSLGSWGVLRPYVGADVKRDNKSFDFNNFVGATTGLALEWRAAPGIIIAIGAEYQWERRTRTDRTLSGLLGFVRWSGYVREPLDVTLAGTEPAHILMSTWGHVRFPSSLEDLPTENAVLEGAIEVGIDLIEVAPKTRINGFSEVGYDFDSEGLFFNNSVSPALGFKLRTDVLSNLNVELGVKYVVEHRFVTGRTRDGLMAFVNWYAGY